MVIKRAKLKLDEDTLKHVYSYFEKEDLRLLHELDEGCVGSVPLALRIRKESIPKEIYDCYNSLMKNQSFELTKNSSPDLVLTIYLLNVGEYVNEKLYDHFLFFAKILRNCYFEHGEEVYRMCFSQKEGPGVVAYLPNFCLEECKYIPIVCDFMVRCYIPFDYKDANLSLMELMLFDFCNWMRKRGLTYVVTTLNKDYRLENKPVLLPKPKLSPLKNGKEKELDNNMSNSS